jgi:hypothetical protein
MGGQGYHTPIDRFFVRDHTGTPLIVAGLYSPTGSRREPS